MQVTNSPEEKQLEEQESILVGGIYHYKNAIYNGNISCMQHKQDAGILLFDLTAVAICRFTRDNLQGPAVIWLQHNIYFMGTFCNNAINGPFILRSTDWTIYSASDHGSKPTIIVFISKQALIGRIWCTDDNKSDCIIEIKVSQYDSEEAILNRLKKMGQALDFEQFPSVKMMIESCFKQEIQVQSRGDILKVCLIGKQDRKIELYLKDEWLDMYGIFEDGKLQGLGFSKQLHCQLQGVFRGGKIHGIGLKKQPMLSNGHKFTLGQFKLGELRHLQMLLNKEEEAIKQMSKIKKTYHIRQLNYINSYINERPIHLLKNLVKVILDNECSYEEQIAGNCLLKSTIRADTEERQTLKQSGYKQITQKYGNGVKPQKGKKARHRVWN